MWSARRSSQFLSYIDCRDEWEFTNAEDSVIVVLAVLQLILVSFALHRQRKTEIKNRCSFVLLALSFLLVSGARKDGVISL